MAGRRTYWGRVTGLRFPFTWISAPVDRLILDQSSITLRPLIGRRLTFERHQIERVEVVDDLLNRHLRFRKADGTLAKRVFRPTRPKRVRDGLVRNSWAFEIVIPPLFGLRQEG